MGAEMERISLMKLLILTQKVDRDDPTLGFFHRWIEECAKHCERVTVICLQKGKHNLPENVRVLSLGKEENASRLRYLGRLYRYVWNEQKNYDAVFVHMNPEYIVLCGLLWRILGKKIGLWYVHKSVTLKLRLATLLTHRIFTASLESFRLRSAKVSITGHGIDTDFFTPDVHVAREQHVLSVGRLSKIKRHDLAIQATALAKRELRIVGEGPERGNLESLAQKLGARALFLGGLTQTQLRDEYRKAAYLVHASETGSLDKVVIEALATDLAVITTADTYKNFPVRAVGATPESVADALGVQRENSDRVTIIRENHSLQRLIPAIMSSL